FLAGGDHAFGEVVVAHAIEHHHIQATNALDVLGTRLVGMRIEAGGNQRHHFGLVADDVADVAVVGMQGDADAQALALGGVGQSRQQGGAQTDENGSQQTAAQWGAMKGQHEQIQSQWRCWRLTPASNWLATWRQPSSVSAWSRRSFGASVRATRLSQTLVLSPSRRNRKEPATASAALRPK